MFARSQSSSHNRHALVCGQVVPLEAVRREASGLRTMGEGLLELDQRHFTLSTRLLSYSDRIDEMNKSDGPRGITLCHAESPPTIPALNMDHNGTTVLA